MQSSYQEFQDAATALLVMYSIVRTPLTSLQHAEPAAAINRINAATINTNCAKRLRRKALCTFRTPRYLHGYFGYLQAFSALTHLWVVPIDASLRPSKSKSFKFADGKVKWVCLKFKVTCYMLLPRQLAIERI